MSRPFKLGWGNKEGGKENVRSESSRGDREYSRGSSRGGSSRGGSSRGGSSRGGRGGNERMMARGTEDRNKNSGKMGLAAALGLIESEGRGGWGGRGGGTRGAEERGAGWGGRNSKKLSAEAENMVLWNLERPWYKELEEIEAKAIAALEK